MEKFTKKLYAVADDIHISFTDSGPPPSSTDYTTVVILHGSVFSGEGFEHLHAFAHRKNLRLVVWNRRDYRGSTPYTDEELNDIKQGNRLFLEHWAVQLAEFLRKFIEEENIPPIAADRNGGGITIMGWSMGNATALSLLSDPALLKDELYALLKRYLKGLVLYDPPFVAFGYALPPDVDRSKLYSPFADPDAKSAQENAILFLSWVSSSYDHGSGVLASKNLHDLNAHAKRTDNCLADTWSKSELDKSLHLEAGPRSEFPMFVDPMQSTIREVVKKALFDENLTQSFFPDVSTVYLYAPHSVWMTVWAYIETRRLYEDHLKANRGTRSMRFVELAGQNHFAHAVEPEKFLDYIVQSLRPV
ncbi:hypothetical protein V5O48_009145 [Marasmius crinis-equi]|uniref:AB hydrolase-1 domain-containing protein n=1 Tax=Marasmius crinis-equi TaxID=585013 RepID=A0ABR3FCG2_9AGAR